MERCPWPKNDELYIKYHDEEWGEYTGDDKKHFEFLVLESAQAGLSWLTILRRRENYREAYAGFNPDIVSKYNQDKIEELMNNAGIIRNRKKIEASINNAVLFLKLQQEFGSFNNYLLSFTLHKRLTNYIEKIENLPPMSIVSDRISKDMKKRGFKFLGSTIMYAHLQAVGIINDHIMCCFKFKKIKDEGEEILGGIYTDKLVLYNAGIQENNCKKLNELVIIKKEDNEIIGNISIVENKNYKIKIKNIKGKNEYKSEAEAMIIKYLDLN
ncbi:MAG: DNA-3-methyladenine glycosylase I [Clostridiaceae bacterium]